MLVRGGGGDTSHAASREAQRERGREVKRERARGRDEKEERHIEREKGEEREDREKDERGVSIEGTPTPASCGKE